jgi:uncharacterized protein (TIGR00299 family) protein
LKAAWFDCFSGVSGDMCLGALLDAGASPTALKRGLRRLPVKGYRLLQKKVRRSGLEATKVDVILSPSSGQARRWKDVREIIRKAGLPDVITEKGLEIFRSLFEAEGRVHGRAYHRVHLHELGAVDTLIDVIGSLICLEELGVKRVYSSALNLGGGAGGVSGAVMTAHGSLPVPAPATAELLRGVPVYSSGSPFELTTPTGAAILRGVSAGFGGMPPMRAEAVGYGAGQRNGAGKGHEMPNLLRVFIGLVDPADRPAARGDEEITVIETNIDDMNPQAYEYVMQRLLREGALEVYLTPVIMKKGRPGILLTVLCHEEKRPLLSESILRETTTIGLRFRREQRTLLERTVRRVTTGFGQIRVKEARLGGGVLSATPEYEDCKRAAKRHNTPLIEVLREVRRQAEKKEGGL